jgi:hypothetical protein
MKEVRMSFLWAYREDPTKLWQIIGAIFLIFIFIVGLGWWAGINQ